MADLEKLIVSLQADLKQYEAQLAKAQSISTSRLRAIERQAQASANRMEGAFGRVGASIKAGILGALTIGTFKQLADVIQSNIKYIADLAEEAQKAGISVENLQRLIYAGAQAGLKQEQVVAIFAKFNRTLDEARAKGMKVGDTVEEFLKVADAVKGAGDAAAAGGIAFKNFGKQGTEALPLLLQGSQAITKSMGEAKIATDALVTAADEFYDKWAATLANWGNLFAAEITKAAVSLDNAFTAANEKTISQLELRRDELVNNLDKLRNNLTGGFFNAGAIQSAEDELADITERLKFLKMAAKDAGTTPPLGEKTPGEATATPKAVASSVKEITDRVGDMNTEIAKTPDPNVEAWVTAMNDLRDAFKDSFADLAVAAGDGKIKLQEVMSVVESLRDKLIRMAAEKIFEIIFGSTDTGGGLIEGLLQGRASGGHVNKGQPYMVGEQGRELFVPSSSGKIIPGGSASGAAPIINIVNQGNIETTQRTSNAGGRTVTEIINRAIENRFPDLLNRNAPLIGARPIAKRTS